MTDKPNMLVVCASRAQHAACLTHCHDHKKVDVTCVGPQQPVDNTDEYDIVVVFSTDEWWPHTSRFVTRILDMVAMYGHSFSINGRYTVRLPNSNYYDHVYNVPSELMYDMYGLDDVESYRCRLDWETRCCVTHTDRYTFEDVGHTQSKAKHVKPMQDVDLLICTGTALKVVELNRLYKPKTIGVYDINGSNLAFMKYVLQVQPLSAVEYRNCVDTFMMQYGLIDAFRSFRTSWQPVMDYFDSVKPSIEDYHQIRQKMNGRMKVADIIADALVVGNMINEWSGPTDRVIVEYTNIFSNHMNIEQADVPFALLQYIFQCERSGGRDVRAIGYSPNHCYKGCES